MTNLTLYVKFVICAHFRPRHISSILNGILSWSPSIAIMGMRQTGKSTLIQRY